MAGAMVIAWAGMAAAMRAMATHWLRMAGDVSVRGIADRRRVLMLYAVLSGCIIIPHAIKRIERMSRI